MEYGFEKSKGVSLEQYHKLNKFSSSARREDSKPIKAKKRPIDNVSNNKQFDTKYNKITSEKTINLEEVDNEKPDGVLFEDYYKLKDKCNLTSLMSGCLGEILLPNGFRKREKKDGKLSTSNLVDILSEKKTIPLDIKDNATLHGVLLTRILLETLEAIQVPQNPNAKEMLTRSMGLRNQKELEALEKETGVSLEHYYKLNRDQLVRNQMKENITMS